MSYLGDLSDLDLQSLLIKGNPVAFEELYDRYHDVLYGYIYNKIRNKEEAQDIVHDVLVKIWDKKEQLNNVISLKSYLFTSVRNKAFDLIAKKKVSNNYLDTLDTALEKFNPAADYLIREKELDSYIKMHIEQLAPKMKEVFKLSRYDYMSNSEIADLLGISKNTVETQIKRALKALRYKLTSLLTLIIMLLFA